MRSWHRLAEQRIRQAERAGKFSGLAGEANPLSDRHGDAFIDPCEAVGHRIMAEAAALSEKLKLKRALEAAREAWAGATDPAEKKACTAAIADLEMRNSIAREARLKFLGRSGNWPRPCPSGTRTRIRRQAVRSRPLPARAPCAIFPP
jgi:hypothetical protein